jgi:geranylgeranyl diphosphate synthase type I
VEAVVAIESFWKRVMVRVDRSNDSSPPRVNGRPGRWDTAGVSERERAEALARVRREVDEVLARFLADRRAELAGLDPDAVPLADEIVRVVRAGGKRIRPALCVWAFRAAGGADVDERILRAGAAIELLHTSALVHDDVMDRDVERRGEPATHVRFAKEAPAGVDPDGFGTAAAVLVGDLALVLSERLMRTCGFEGERLDAAMTRFDRMRVEMAAGQFLDVAGSERRERVRALKTASYTAEGPVLIGAALAGADAAAEGALGVFGRLLGEAFQLRDDALDEAPDAATGTEIDDLLSRAARALEGAPLRPEGAGALVAIADALRMETAG